MSRSKKFILLPLLGIGFIALGGWVVMLLWNAILPGLIAGVGKLTYIKAIGLLALCKILFGSFRGKHQGRSEFRNGFRLKEKMKNMSEEEKEKFKAEWKERCRRRSN